MQIDQIFWHDSRIRKVIEVPAADLLLFQVSYPVDWETNSYAPYTIRFVGFHTYEIHEGPFTGELDIMEATLLDGNTTGIKTIKLDTNAGYRIIRCADIQLVEGTVSE